MYRGEHFRENQPSGPSGPLWITQTQKRSSENIKKLKKKCMCTRTRLKKTRKMNYFYFLQKIFCVGLSLTFLPSIYTTLTREPHLIYIYMY